MTHSPTPWKLEDSDPAWPPHLVGADCHVALVMNKSHVAYEANAAFIVTAVNSHEALVEALKAARKQLEPFAAVAAIFSDREPQHGDIIHGWEFSSGSADLRVSHCKAAAKSITEIDAALQSIQPVPALTIEGSGE
jgi:hypothetical protein